MRLDLAFRPREIIDRTVEQQYDDVLAQLREWADAEPNVANYEVLHVWRSPDSYRHTIEVELAMREQPDQLVLDLSA